MYINQSTGERIISFENAEPTAAIRGDAWSWDNTIVDGCAPDQNSPLVTSIYTAVMDEQAGDAGSLDGVKYWHDWFEHPGDTILSNFTFYYFTQLPDPGEDGVAGSEFIIVFTENDSPTSTANAVAHSPIIISDLVGAEDDGADGGLNAQGQPILAGDGIIDFAEGNIWVVFVDFGGAVPCDVNPDAFDIELGDTNGVYDGESINGVFSGVPGVDTDGDGMINSGFVIGFRQPDVAEGDGLIDRFPELAGVGLENPDGFDLATFENIRPMGAVLAGPSTHPESYDNFMNFGDEWPWNPAYVPLPGEAIGAIDGAALINAEGTESGLISFGGFECDPDAISAPYYLNPWTGWGIGLNTGFFKHEGCPLGCNLADIAEPYNVLDLADINAFISGFTFQDEISDIAEPIGVWDLTDITTFITGFQAGCP